MKELYSEVVMNYAKDKSVRGRIENAMEEEDSNQSCGDEIKLYLIVEDGRVKDAKFEGVGCIVSQASAAMLVKLIKGKSLDEVKRVLENVKKMVKGEDFDEEILGDLVVFSGISGIPQRSKCFYLSWSVLERMYDRMKRGDKN